MLSLRALSSSVRVLFIRIGRLFLIMKKDVNMSLLYLLVFSLSANIIVAFTVDSSFKSMELKINLTHTEFQENLTSCLNASARCKATLNGVVDYCNLKVEAAVNQTMEQYKNFSIGYINSTLQNDKVYRDKLYECVDRYARLKEHCTY
jgi:hypothetical protein